jgi:ElaB/YqjD/DUF883 family membrane-anchored ribosome-binding protein
MEDLQDKIIELMDLFDDEEVTTADKIERPQRALDREAIDDFMKRNPMAGGGMLVQPSADGSRPGYRSDKVQTAKEVEVIKLKTEPLNKAEKLKLYRSYDNLFRQEYKRLVSIGDPFSKTDLNRAVINRIANENPTINLREGIGLDKIPGGGNEESKTLFERYDKTARGPLFTKKELKNFTQGNAVNARVNTKTQEAVFKLILDGNSNKTQLAKTLKISEGRLSYNIEKLMRNLAKGSGDQYTFLKDYKEKDLEKVRNNIYESPTLEKAYQRTIVQSVLQSTKLGSPERKQALNKLKEFNKFKEVMLENGIDPKILALDHAASYRAIKNGNIKTFLSVTPVIKDINTLKSSFDKRSQLNLRRMKDYLLAGDTKNYKYFLKNQTELENLWKTMTGGQSSLGRIRVTATGPQKGKIKIFDYGATSLLDKNKNLINELADNLSIRQNIVNASSVKNLDEARRIMLEGSELTEKKMLGTLKTTDRAAKTQIDQSFKNLNKPEMFKTETKIKNLILNYAGTVTDKCAVNLKANGGRIGYSLGSEACLKIGKEALDNGLTKGFKNKQQVDLAGLILKGGAGLKSAFALRNIFGPAAIAATIGFEGGLIGYDMLTSGKTLREAFGDNLLNYALGKDYQIDPQEELFKRFKGLGYDDQQIGGIKKALDAMNTINTGTQLAMDVGQKQEALQKSRGQTEEFMIPDDQMMADTAGQRAEQNLKDARERLTTFNQSLEAVDRPGGMKKEDVLSEYFSSGKYAEDLDLFNQAEKKANIQKLESAGPKFMGSVFPQFEKGRQEDLANLRSVINPAFNIPGARDATFIPGKTTGGLFGLAEGGRAGYKLGKLIKQKPSKVRSDAKSIIDENIKLMKQMKETGEIDEISSDLNQVIKKALNEDLFDKKDRIVDSINISEAKKRRNYPYNQQVFEEPKNLDFYTAIQESNFKTKTGPYFDRIRRLKKAGGGLLKQAGDRSGPPPESGPNSQGLQGLLNRVKKI